MMSTETEQVYLQNSRELSISVLSLRKKMQKAFMYRKVKRQRRHACHTCKAASAALCSIASM